MEKIIYVLVIVLAFLSCKEERFKGYVTLSGTIINKNSDSLIVRSGIYSKKIHVNKDGVFLDTLKVETGNYSLTDGTEYTIIYLKNGFDVGLSIDTKQFDKTLKYTGIGAEANNYLAQKALLQDKILFDITLNDLSKEVFDKKINNVFDEIKSLLENTMNLDSIFVVQQNKSITYLKKTLVEAYENK